MTDFSIGISGIKASQRAIETIGNNIANAATEGYHRRRIEFSPAYAPQVEGAGVEVDGVNRMINVLLEQEIFRQQSLSSGVSREVSTLQTIENAFGELSTDNGGLSALIDKFFSSLQDLSANPAGTVWQNQLLSDAEAMAGQFRQIAEFLNSIQIQLELEIESTIRSINIITNQIGELNGKIERIEMIEGNASAITDQRDQLISDLSELIGIQTISREHGVTDISAHGIPLVTNITVNNLVVGMDDNLDMGLCIEGSSNYSPNVKGGMMGGLLSLRNTLVSDIQTDLHSLAGAIIQQMNQYHVQGVGSQGSFTGLTGWANSSGDLSDISSVSDGSIFIRVTNMNTDVITRSEIVIDAGNDSLSDIAAAISGVTGVTSSVNSSNQLTISANAGYKFDFLPAVLSGPTSSDLTGTISPPTMSVSGIYTGAINDTFKFTVVGDGNVSNGNLEIKVTNKANETIDTLSLGSGYAAGDKIEVGNSGVKIALSIGDLLTGNTFEVDVFGNSDTSGVLAAVGINTLFFGNNALDFAVCADISANPKRVATSLGADMTDNVNIVRMANMKEKAVSSLNSLTCGDFYHQMITDIGQQLSVKQMRLDNAEVTLLNLTNQRNEVSGVNINDEAARLLVFEQMFQGMAKYMTTVNETMQSLLDLI